MDKAELLDRTKGFSLRMVKVADALPNTAAGRAIANQTVRSGTSEANELTAIFTSARRTSQNQTSKIKLQT